MNEADIMVKSIVSADNIFTVLNWGRLKKTKEITSDLHVKIYKTVTSLWYLLDK